MQKLGVSKKSAAKPLQDLIVESIQDKKGQHIVSLDLREIEDASTDFFIICHGDSTPQVKAIADNILQKVKEETGETPWNKEGYENMEWVLLDYVDVVVHIFINEKREFYQLEELWNDARATVYDEY